LPPPQTALLRKNLLTIGELSTRIRQCASQSHFSVPQPRTRAVFLTNQSGRFRILTPSWPAD